MDFSKKENRQLVGKHFKNIFHNFIMEAVKKVGKENFSYMDMKLVSDAMIFEIPKNIELRELPPQIKKALKFAVAVMEPNKNKRDELLKNFFKLGTGATGATVLTASLLTKAGLMATIKAALFGGLAIGIGPIAGTVCGLGLLVATVHMHINQMTPEEKIAKCIEVVDAGVDDWIEKGCNENISL